MSIMNINKYKDECVKEEFILLSKEINYSVPSAIKIESLCREIIKNTSNEAIRSKLNAILIIYEDCDFIETISVVRKLIQSAYKIYARV